MTTSIEMTATFDTNGDETKLTMDESGIDIEGISGRTGTINWSAFHKINEMVEWFDRARAVAMGGE